MKTKRDILVVDDERIIVEAVIKICASEGWHVEAAMDAKEALAKLDNREYNIIICDIMMPGIDGFGFLNELSHRNIKTPVIMTTGYSTVENALQSLNMGAIDFIPKPFTADELINAVIRAENYLKVLHMHHMDGSGILVVSCPRNYYMLGYTSWAAEDNSGSMITGATDLYIKALESIKDIEFLQVDEELVQGSTCAQIIDKYDRKHPLISPLTGRIIGVNDDIKNNLSILEKDPYFNGWFYKFIPSESDYELKNLVRCGSEGL